jgi:anti-anti-sigma factor
MNNFSIESQRSGDATLAVVRGELDLAASENAERQLRELEASEPSLLVVDLAEVEFIDSSGLRVLLLAAERAGEAGRRFAAARADGQVRRVIEMTGSGTALELLDEAPPPFGSTPAGD